MSEVKVRRRDEWTEAEVLDVLQQGIDAYKRGDSDEGARLARLFPMDPYAAKAVKNVFGKEYLLSLKMDLSEAEEIYGKNWLDD